MGHKSHYEGGVGSWITHSANPSAPALRTTFNSIHRLPPHPPPAPPPPSNPHCRDRGNWRSKLLNEKRSAARCLPLPPALSVGPNLAGRSPRGRSIGKGCRLCSALPATSRDHSRPPIERKVSPAVGSCRRPAEDSASGHASAGRRQCAVRNGRGTNNPVSYRGRSQTSAGPMVCAVSVVTEPDNPVSYRGPVCPCDLWCKEAVPTLRLRRQNHPTLQAIVDSLATTPVFCCLGLLPVAFPLLARDHSVSRGQVPRHGVAPCLRRLSSAVAAQWTHKHAAAAQQTMVVRAGAQPGDVAVARLPCRVVYLGQLQNVAEEGFLFFWPQSIADCTKKTA
ncbi:hypothetical protein BaRGS_00010260, partial [Batillaria attramentaria]